MSRGSYTPRGLNPQLSQTELVDFLDNDDSIPARTLFVGNLDQRVTRKLLYELMSQAGPVYSIKIVPLRDGADKTFAFVVFDHAVSVRFAMCIFDDVSLFRSKLSMNYTQAHKNKTRPVAPAPRGQVGPTFFELPQGFENTTEEEKRSMVSAWILAHPQYKSGYFIVPEHQATSRQPGAYRGYESSEYRNKRRQEEAPQDNKRRRFSPPSLATVPQIQQSMIRSAPVHTFFNAPEHHGQHQQHFHSHPSPPRQYVNSGTGQPEQYGQRPQFGRSNSQQDDGHPNQQQRYPNHQAPHHGRRDYQDGRHRNGWHD
ncbi:hypothetical protein RvY_01329 [Ramazzottius varieornatus]|uniref:RRM domain-containing protein n=1 Tax=Ramazzottius varieornatus TaxID=947166 RepID=A0A1D1UFY6_RAMVA|nr:hypothetical protein RvY_01329 [Ramazzottius varieornatus]